MSRTRARNVLVGLIAMGLALVLLGVAYLAYDRALVPSSTITLQTDVVGNQLAVGSDVKFNGVPIGHVAKINATEQGADISLALEPDKLHLLPNDVVARLLPKTLFGERYIALVEPNSSSTGATSSTLQAGDVIHQDQGAQAVELQQVLDQMLPMLRAIQPDKLSAMMGEFATMLRGNGEDLGTALVDWSHYVTKLNPRVPQMTEDMAQLARVAGDWNIAAPDLLDALATMTKSSKLLVDEQTNLSDVYASVIGTSDRTGGWVNRNHDTIVILSRESKAALRATAPYASQFPCLFRAVSDYIPKMQHALGEDDGEPGVHAVVQMMPIRSKYLAGQDAVHFTQGTPPPRCPYVTGEVGTTPAKPLVSPGSSAKGAVWPASSKSTTDNQGDPPAIAPPPGSTVESHLLALTGLGDANSPGENELIAELIAPTEGMAPSEFPDWGSLLLGPTLRNTKVVLK